MGEILNKLKEELKQLEQKKKKNAQEQNNLKENNLAVRRYIRLNFEERRLESEISNLKAMIEEEIKLKCHHVFVNINDNGDQCCIKCGLSTELTTVQERKIYEQTKANSIIINTDYACDKKVVETICQVIALEYPYISEDEFVHYFSAAIHNMQIKHKSKNVKRGRCKRLNIRPSLLEKSKML